VDKVFVTIHASLLVSRSGIEDRSVCQHGAPFIRDIKNISMAFLALLILESGICLLSVFFMIVFILDKMNDHIFDAMNGLGKEKIIHILRGGQMTIHAIRNKALSVIGMCRCFPRVIGKLNFVAHGAKLGCRCADHGVVADAEKRKSDNDAKKNINDRLDEPFPKGSFFHGGLGDVFHKPSLARILKSTKKSPNRINPN